MPSFPSLFLACALAWFYAPLRSWAQENSEEKAADAAETAPDESLADVDKELAYWQAFADRRALTRGASTGGVSERQLESADDFLRRFPAASVNQVADFTTVSLPATGPRTLGVAVIVDERNRATGERGLVSSLAELLARSGWRSVIVVLDDAAAPSYSERTRLRVDPPPNASADADADAKEADSDATAEAESEGEAVVEAVAVPVGARRPWAASTVAATEGDKPANEKHWLAFKVQATDRMQAVLDQIRGEAKEGALVVVARGMGADITADLAAREGEFAADALVFVDLIEPPAGMELVMQTRLALIDEPLLAVQWQHEDPLSADGWERVRNERRMNLAGSTPDQVALRIKNWMKNRLGGAGRS